MRADIDFPHRRAGRCGWLALADTAAAIDHTAGGEHVGAIVRLERDGVAARVPG